jgi:hypothetical protein
MQTSEAVEHQFRFELRNLLKKYEAELDVVVNMREYGADVDCITVYIPHSYVDGVVIREEASFDLSKWVSWETV